MKIWKDNIECPNCGKPINKEKLLIRACETGYSYCSEECAQMHVNDWYKEEYNEY